jgi:hypothetical protein
VDRLAPFGQEQFVENGVQADPPAP